jgi:YVTN family beta-propeller protein
MRFDAVRQSLWVLDAGGLTQIALDRPRITAHIPLPYPASDFDVSTKGRAAVVLQDRSQHPARGLLGMVRLSSGTLERTAPVGPSPGLVCFQQNGEQVLVGDTSDRSLSILNTALVKLVVRLRLPMQPARFCSTADGGQLFITGPGMDAVAIVFPYTTEMGETILAGSAPGAMAISESPQYLFVANPLAGTVTVLDIDTRKLVAVVAVGIEPRHIVLTPDDTYALVLDGKSGDLAVIRIAALAARRNKVAPLFTVIPVGGRPVSAAVVRA